MYNCHKVENHEHYNIRCHILTAYGNVASKESEECKKHSEPRHRHVELWQRLRTGDCNLLPYQRYCYARNKHEYARHADWSINVSDDFRKQPRCPEANHIECYCVVKRIADIAAARLRNFFHSIRSPHRRSRRSS